MTCHVAEQQTEKQHHPPSQSTSRCALGLSSLEERIRSSLCTTGAHNASNAKGPSLL